MEKNKVKVTMHCPNCRACNIDPEKRREIFLKKGQKRELKTEENSEQTKERTLYTDHYTITKSIYSAVIRCSICSYILWNEFGYIPYPNQLIKKNGKRVARDKKYTILNGVYVWHKDPKYVGKEEYWDEYDEDEPKDKKSCFEKFFEIFE